MKIPRVLITLALLIFATASPSHAAGKLKALLIDGQNNHQWQQTTPWIKWALEQSGRFTVDVSTTPGYAVRAPQLPKNATPEQRAAFEEAKKKWQEGKAESDKSTPGQWKQWHPNFHSYDVIVSNYNGEMWPENVRKDFVDYVHGGGGFVAVHAADNSFAQWPEYNAMIALGGWGGRNEKDGPMVRFRDGAIVRDEMPGAGGTHGTKHEFVVEAREPEHPILRGLPAKWMHAPDELYAKLRGPAKNLIVLATAFSAPDQRGTGENEPILMVVNYGKGRVFHTTLGHDTNSMAGLGFQVTLARGAEWVATGKVTLRAPKAGELTADKAALREMSK